MRFRRAASHSLRLVREFVAFVAAALYFLWEDRLDREVLMEQLMQSPANSLRGAFFEHLFRFVVEFGPTPEPVVDPDRTTFDAMFEPDNQYYAIMAETYWEPVRDYILAHLVDHFRGLGFADDHIVRQLDGLADRFMYGSPLVEVGASLRPALALDEASGHLYWYLGPSGGKGIVGETIPLDAAGQLFLDYTEDGRPFGIEVLNYADLPEVPALVEQLWALLNGEDERPLTAMRALVRQPDPALITMN